jgi:hypothetical protein
VRPPTTPGLAGYWLAVLVSIGVTALSIALQSLPADGLGGAAAVFIVGTVYVTIFAVPTAPIGVLLVHLACRRVQDQRVHVLVAGLAGILTGVVFGLLIDVGSGVFETWSFTLTLGIATATGRAVVIPLVPAVRDRKQHPALPVDDDFAGTPHGW